MSKIHILIILLVFPIYQHTQKQKLSGKTSLSLSDQDNKLINFTDRTC